MKMGYHQNHTKRNQHDDKLQWNISYGDLTTDGPVGYYNI